MVICFSCRLAAPTLLASLTLAVFSLPTQAQTPAQFANGPSQVSATSSLINRLASHRPVASYKYRGRKFPVQRTPPTALPKRYGDLIATLESQLDRCWEAMMTDSLGVICTFEQQQELRNAMNNLLRAHLHWDTAGYQAEIAFYQAEDNRRRLATALPK